MKAGVSRTKSLRLAIDIGGTFTDTVLMGGAGAVLASAKTLTTHASPADGAVQGAASVLKGCGREFSELTGLIHGTTLATNALIERRGARLASVTTEGFRDILEIGYERRYSQYDIFLEKPEQLVPRERSFTVRERMSAGGDTLIDLDDSALDDLLDDLDECGAEAVAICLLHAYANPVHERRLRDLITRARPSLAVSISSEVSPEAREYERLSTTAANAYVQPLMGSYLAQLERGLANNGLACPILMMTAGGGMCSVETAKRHPIRLVESGPAGGAILAARVAETAGLNKVLSLDVGGTTAKLCLIDGARPQTSRQFEIARAERFIKGSGLPVRIPVIEMIEIGAGGGSIASVDGLGRINVGPRSAGSEPGPAAFARGGTEPTVTDADIELGYIVPESFGEGRIEIDPEAARRALKTSVGDRLRSDSIDSADGISRIVSERMASAGRMHAVESGTDLDERTMIAFGGNGPLHATRVARSAGVSKIVVPPSPGVGSAVGFLYAPVSFEIVRSHYSLLESLDLESVNSLFEEMAAEALGVVREAASPENLESFCGAFMRYSGQGHEIEIPLPDRPLAPPDLGNLADAFEGEYRRQFSRPVPGMDIEILNWSLRVSTPRMAAPPTPPALEPAPITSSRTRRIVCDITGDWIDAAVVERTDLNPGDALAGPALVIESQTTTLVSADLEASVDGAGNLVLERLRTGP